MRAGGLLIAALIASSCGGAEPEREPRPSPRLGAGLAPLPAELLGSWDASGGDTVFRTAFLPPSHATCRRRSTPGVGCYTVRALRGPGAVSKAVFEWGPAGLRENRLVMIPVVAGKPSCARRPMVAEYQVRKSRLVLTAAEENCLGDRPGDRTTARRSPSP